MSTTNMPAVTMTGAIDILTGEGWHRDDVLSVLDQLIGAGLEADQPDDEPGVEITADGRAFGHLAALGTTEWIFTDDELNVARDQLNAPDAGR